MSILKGSFHTHTVGMSIFNDDPEECSMSCPLITCPYIVARYGTVIAFSTNKLSYACCRVGISPSPSSSESSISLTYNNYLDSISFLKEE